MPKLATYFILTILATSSANACAWQELPNINMIKKAEPEELPPLPKMVVRCYVRDPKTQLCHKAEWVEAEPTPPKPRLNRGR